MCECFWLQVCISLRVCVVFFLFCELGKADLIASFPPAESSFCKAKTDCSRKSNSVSWPSKSCYCDNLCDAFEDCCHDFHPSVDFDVPEADLFQCTAYPEIHHTHNISNGILIVSKCPETWLDDNIRNLCENITPEKDDMLSRLLVSENDTDIVFKNMYCAYCNSRYDFNFWKTEVSCEDDWFDDGNVSISRLLLSCDLHFLPPSQDTRYRKCSTEKIISACPENIAIKTLRDKCENGSTSYVFSSSHRHFKNRDCAKCHNVSIGDIFCLHFYLEFGGKPYSFRVLVDFNTREMENMDIYREISKVKNPIFSTVCSNEELYDPFSEKCRKIYCPPPRVPIKGRCETVNLGYGAVEDLSNITYTNGSSNLNSVPKNCTLVRLEQSEYVIRNDTKLMVYSSGKVFESWQYYQSEDGIFICNNARQQCESDCHTRVVFQSDFIEGYVTLILLVISLAALAVNFFIYACFPQLRNTPGKILMCLIASLFLAQLFFLVSPYLEGTKTACIVIAVIVHFFYIAAFCWMNVIALDLWITFANPFATADSNESSKRFGYFSLYAWIVPIVIVTFSVIVDNVDSETYLQYIQPRYGDSACSITSRTGILFLFVGPLALFKVFDVIAFLNTARHIYKAKKQGSVAREGNDTCAFWINLKLSLVMGLTWVFAFVANITNEAFVWYLFIIFNALQGVFIAITFILTGKVARLFSEKVQKITSPSNRSGQNETPIPENIQPSKNSGGTKFSSLPTQEP